MVKPPLPLSHYQSSTQNKLIAEAFYLTRDIEKYGSGYIRVRKEIADYPTMRFTYEESGDGYFASLSYIEQRVESTKTTTPKTTREQLLELIRKDNRITREALASELGISVNGVKQQIRKLKLEGVLERIGSNRTGHWKIS